MMYREVAPHPRLREHVKCLWMLDHDYGNSPHDHEHLWADAHTELIFTSGRRYTRQESGRSVALPRSFVIGPFQSELQLFCSGRVTLAAARFWPWGFRALSRIPMADLKNTVRSCRVALGNASVPVALAVGGECSPDVRLARLEDALLKVLASAARPKLHARTIAVDILEARGVTRIGDLLQKHRIPARRLQRIFLDEIGVTAKVFCRIVRFNHAKSALQENPGFDLIKLAYECGYADQAHFTRSFREMFGITPTAFKAQMNETSRQLGKQGRDVVFLQDESPQHR